MGIEELIELLTAKDNGISGELYATLLKKRMIYINEDVTDEWIDKVTMQIILLNMEEEDIPKEELKPIRIYLNTYGGSADTCLHLIQVIENSRIPIHIHVLAMAASAGLYITVAGHHRVGYKNSIFLLHKGSISVGGNASSAEDTMDFYKGPVQEKFDDLIIRRTHIDTAELKKIKRNETYCLGEEALRYGFIDQVI